MSKLIKIIGYLVGGVVALLVIAIVAITLFVDANEYRDQISQVVKKETGRELQIKGNLKYSLFPWVGLSIGETTLGNAAGFGDTPFAHFSQIDVKVKLLPLLSKKIEMDTVSVDGMQLNLMRNSKGQSNWDDLSKASAGKKETERKTGHEATELAGIAVNGIDIKNARLSWDDRQQNQKYVVDKIRLHTDAISADKPMNLDAGFELQDQKTGKNWPFAMSSIVSLDMGKQLAKLDKLKLQLADLKLEGTVQATGIQSSPNVQGSLASNEFVPRDLMKSLGLAIPDMADKSVLGKARLDMSFKANPQSANLDKLMVLLDDSRIDGQLSVTNFTKPAVRFQLKLDEIDVDRYLPPPTEKTAATQSTAAAGIPSDVIRGLNVKGDISIGKLKAANLKSEQIKISVNAQNGLLRVYPSQAKLYGGSYNGDVSVDARGSQPVLSMDEKLEGIQAEPLFKDAADLDWIKGQATMSARLSGTGQQPDQIKKTLNGNAGFAFKDGAIKGMNIIYEIRKAYAQFKGQKIPAEEIRETTFTELKGTAVVTNGVINNQDLVMQSPLLRVTGAGTVDLAKEELDYSVQAVVVATLEGQGGEALEKLKGINIPVRIQGTFAQPKFKIDMEKILTEGAKKELKEKATKKLEEKVDDKLKDKLKNIFNR